MKTKAEERAKWLKGCALEYNFGSREAESRPYRERIARLIDDVDEATRLLRNLINGIRSMRGGDQWPIIEASRFLTFLKSEIPPEAGEPSDG